MLGVLRAAARPDSVHRARAATGSVPALVADHEILNAARETPSTIHGTRRQGHTPRQLRGPVDLDVSLPPSFDDVGRATSHGPGCRPRGPPASRPVEPDPKPSPRGTASRPERGFRSGC